jgi:hypothetical protein
MVVEIPFLQLLIYQVCFMNLLCKDFSIKIDVSLFRKTCTHKVNFLNFQEISGISLNFQEISGIFAKFPGCFQDCGVGMGDFIPKPGFVYLFRSWNTFSNWKKKKSRMGNVQNFTLTTGVFPDQE